MFNALACFNEPLSEDSNLRFADYLNGLTKLQETVRVQQRAALMKQCQTDADEARRRLGLLRKAIQA